MGNEPPILADGRKAPDRREISLRWLAGTFLTGITSSALMGIALFAALDGREQLAIPAEAVAAIDMGDKIASDGQKGSRLVAPVVASKPSDRTLMSVSTMIREGDRDVVRKQPFAHYKIALGGNHNTQESYPRFDPLTIFASGDTAPQPASRTGIIYGAQVDSEVSLKTTDFPIGGTQFDYAATMSMDEVEEIVRSTGSVLTDGSVQVAALHYVDPRRFAALNDGLDFGINFNNARVTTENVSVSSFEPYDGSELEFGDDIIPARQDVPLKEAMVDAGYDDETANAVAGALGRLIGTQTLAEGNVLRLGVEQTREATRVVRASVYSNLRHVATVALEDSGRFVSGAEPPFSDTVAAAFNDTPVPTIVRRDLPRIYDGIYRAALSYGMNKDMVAQIVKLLASNVDFQSRLKPTDQLEVFFSAPNENGQATDESELLFVNAQFGDNTLRFYRFQDPEDGSVDYFYADGKSIRQFLLRNPVPSGQFRSPFGMRRHPILKYSRMHWGVDWSAPRGTPILATGNGTVEKAGWHSGYGRQTIIRHANGYESSYNHQSAIAKGIKPGARVRQGQVIGYVGSTGLATGPHLHYELIVNGTKVDPMRVRLPDRKPLEGAALAEFERERKRIDTLLGYNDETEVASR